MAAGGATGWTCRGPEAVDLGEFERREREAPGPSPPGPDGRVADRYAFVLALFTPGEFRLPDLKLPYVDRAGREFAVTAPGGVVRCRSVLANESEVGLKPPPEPVPVIVEDRTLVYAGGALGLVLVTALLAFVAARIWQGRQRVVPPPPAVPAEVIARGRLETLRGRDLPGQGLVKEFYLELSHILREYFGNRYRTNALEMTSTELLEFLTDARLGGVPRETVTSFLDESDLVKFAKARPSEQEIEEIFRVAYEIVERTTPREPAPTPAGGEGAP